MTAIVMTLVAGAAVAALFIRPGRATRLPPEARLQIVGGTGEPVVSPDGRQIAYVGMTDEGRGSQISVRPLKRRHRQGAAGYEPGGCSLLGA